MSKRGLDKTAHECSVTDWCVEKDDAWSCGLGHENVHHGRKIGTSEFRHDHSASELTKLQEAAREIAPFVEGLAMAPGHNTWMEFFVCVADNDTLKSTSNAKQVLERIRPNIAFDDEIVMDGFSEADTWCPEALLPLIADLRRVVFQVCSGKRAFHIAGRDRHDDRIAIFCGGVTDHGDLLGIYTSLA